MTTTLSKEDYLKRYLSGDTAKDEKKKKKKKKEKVKEKKGVAKIAPRMKIIDNDAEVPVMYKEKKVLASESEDDDEEDLELKPTIAHMEDERPEEIRIREQFEKSGRWKTFTGENITAKKLVEEVIKKEPGDIKEEPQDDEYHDALYKHKKKKKRKDRDNDVRIKTEPPEVKQEPLSPPHHAREYKTTTDISNTRIKTEKNSDDDNSPPRRRQRHDSDDDSPPRRRRRHDSDNSPPRQRHDSDNSPHRKRHDSDTSPPRQRQRHVSDDNSPPRRRTRHDSDDVSPPRKPKNQTACDSDASPPRKRHARAGSDSDASPPRRKATNNSDSDASPPRRRGGDDDSDASPPRRGDEGGKMTKTLDGKRAGLQQAKDLKTELEEIRNKEKKTFENMDTAVSGRFAETKVRGRLAEAEAKKAAEKEKKEVPEEIKRKFETWNKGVKQVKHSIAQVEDNLYEMSKPLTRTENDVDRDAMLRDQEREEDPMAAYMRKKKETKQGKVKKFPRYTGPQPPPNRFGIWPGYRWDGVVRTNGFETKLLTKDIRKNVEEIEAYKMNLDCE